MDHSWRPRPPPPPPPPPEFSGNISNVCPVCSISHFPFCPPPFSGNPRFHPQPHNDYYHQRPPFDHHPFPPTYHHQETSTPNTMNYNYNYSGASDGFIDRRPPWQGSNPSSGTSYMMPANAQGNYYLKNDVRPDSYGYDHGGVKRMRIEPTDSSKGSSGVFMAGESNDASRFSSENERILRLIRDHGNAVPGGLPQGGAGMFSESNGYVQGRLGDSCEARDDMGSKRRRETNDFQNLGVESFERTESGLSSGPGLDLHDSSREDRGVVSLKNSVQYDQYGQVENSVPHSLDQSRYSHPAVHFDTMGRSEQIHDEFIHHDRGAVPYHSSSLRSQLKQQPLLQQDMNYPATEILHQNDHNLQLLTPNDTSIDSHHPYPSQKNLQSPPFMIHHHLQQKGDILRPNLPGDIKKSVAVNTLAHEGIPSSVGYQNSRTAYCWTESKEGHYPPSSFGRNLGRGDVSPAYNVQPPLPASPPPPLPMALPRNHLSEPFVSPVAKKPSLFPIAVSSSADFSSSRAVVPENQLPAQAFCPDKASHHALSVPSAEEFHAWQSSSEQYVSEIQPFPLRHLSSQKQNTIDAAHIFKPPYRTTRPDHLVIILRGLPGSGKSYLAKMLRDLEVENGGKAPRIHAMDEYFMTEVEKAEESEASKSSGSLKAKRPVMKKVMEYCYEPEMEEAYRASMLKAFKKTLDEGVYSFVIVDDRNLRVADFAQFWATAKRSGYEVYLLEASYKDPAGCAARNVHNFTQNDIQMMAGQWEEAPSLYLKLDIKSLLHGDGFEESGIQEVDMDMEDGDPIDTSQGSDHRSPQNTIKDPVDDIIPHGPLKDAKHLPESHAIEEVKHLSRSKWSNDLDDSEFHEAEGRKGNASALSGLVQAYSKEGKSVRWGDQGGDAGFSLSATRKTSARSLVIGPGSGYNLKSNPLAEEENLKFEKKAVEPKRQTVFQERMRAERESFKAVFDKRRQRIGGFNADEE